MTGEDIRNNLSVILFVIGLYLTIKGFLTLLAINMLLGIATLLIAFPLCTLAGIAL